MTSMDTFEKAFAHELGDIHNAEKQITRALPKMIRNASNPDLKRAFEKHLKQTEQQIDRVERCFEILGQKPGRTKCAGMEGLVEEGSQLLKDDVPGPIRDALLIGAAQKVEHYEIAAYGTLCTWADQLGATEVRKLLGQNLSEEKETDQKLTELAEAGVNVEAAAATDGN